MNQLASTIKYIY